MVFKTKHFGIIAAAIMLGVGLWVLPGFLPGQPTLT